MDRGTNVDVREGLRQEKFEVYGCMEAMGKKCGWKITHGG